MKLNLAFTTHKPQFWDRVDDGREREDTLVREIATQVKLTCIAPSDLEAWGKERPDEGITLLEHTRTHERTHSCVKPYKHSRTDPGWAGKNHAVGFRSMFETLDELVIEMELMESTDLSDRLAETGSLSEVRPFT